MTSSTNIFHRILQGEIPGDILFQDELCFVLRDIYPKAPFHVLVIPKKPIATAKDLQPEDEALMGHLMMVGNKMALENACEGYRFQMNVGRAGGQEVFQIHLHVLGWLS